jgi:threonine dehydrogenase-like Zn-dependent dehydrogenase
MPKLSTYRTTFPIPATMQAVVLSGLGFDNVAVRQVPVPQPGPSQLLARVDAAGVCTSILKIMDQGPAHTYFRGWDPAQWPVILGDEGSITVVKVGAALAGQYRVGQRLAIQPGVELGPINHRERYRDHGRGMARTAVGYTLGGQLAQYILVPEEVIQGGSLLPLPDENLPYFAVSMSEPVSCVVSAQDRQIHIHKASPGAPRVPRLGMLPGGTTVIIGVGPMGLMHAELALRFRPRNLIVCDKIVARLDRARNVLQAKARDAGVNLLAAESDQLKATLTQVTDGRMADDIVLAVGINPVQQAALDLLGREGVANLFGGLPKGQNMLQVDAVKVHYDEIKLVGSSGGAPSDLALALRAFADGDIDPGNYVFGVGALAHAIEVLRGIKANRIEGKVILYPHCTVDKLTLGLEHWSAQEEERFMEEHLA